MIRKRRANPFSLSFLDIMACGFGAVTLLFLILRHNSAEIEIIEPPVSEEVMLLQQDIEEAQQENSKANTLLQTLIEKITRSQETSKSVASELEKKQRSLQSDPKDDIAKLKKRVQELEEKTADIEATDFGDKVRSFSGDGNRQYLTGLVLGGERVLILVDSSASMLADDVVNAVRRRNMEDSVKLQAPKWRWARRTTEWLLAQLPAYSRFQVYQFNTQANAIVEDTEGQWLDASETLDIENAIEGINTVVPNGGTSLYHALATINQFEQQPDNIFLLTDGLPNHGKAAPRTKLVSGEQRKRYFFEAYGLLPRGIPVNTILFPMEGDPEAAALFWQLALDRGGSFLAPSRDWP